MPKSKTYEEFVEKFKPKLTTDDCITPPLVYQAVLDWVCAEYGVDPASVVRPFWPGQDYKSEAYLAGCVVVDNPPFSILSEICRYYLSNGVKFFLFAPTLTALSASDIVTQLEHIICNAGIIYENGAVVHTSFVTNLGRGDIVLRTAPELSDAINAACKKAKAQTARSLPKYAYPDNVLTAAMASRYCKYGIHLAVKRSDCVRISALDEQRAHKKGVFGCGLLLSEKAAAERAAAERAAAERAAAERAAAERAAAKVWKLSDRELDIVRSLSQ